jgi:hypothetical protein
MKTFNKNDIHRVPVILTDYATQLLSEGNSPEIKENFAQRFEVIREYCDYILNKHYQSRRQERLKRPIGGFPKVESAGLRGTKALGESLLKK